MPNLLSRKSIVIAISMMAIVHSNMVIAQPKPKHKHKPKFVTSHVADGIDRHGIDAQSIIQVMLASSSKSTVQPQKIGVTTNQDVNHRAGRNPVKANSIVTSERQTLERDSLQGLEHLIEIDRAVTNPNQLSPLNRLVD